MPGRWPNILTEPVYGAEPGSTNGLLGVFCLALFNKLYYSEHSIQSFEIK